MVTTRRKVVSTLFLFFFIVWLALILLVTQPTDNLFQFQFSNFSLLALFLGSAIVASLSSMVIGVDLLGFKMKSINLTRKSGIDRVNIKTGELSASSQQSKTNDSILRSEESQGSQIKFYEETHRLAEETILPKHFQSVGEEVFSEKPKESKTTTEKDFLKLQEGDKKYEEKNKEERKAFFLFGETKFSGCNFKLGYLGSLPRNESIPDECFGCPQLLECYQTHTSG